MDKPQNSGSVIFSADFKTKEFKFPEGIPLGNLIFGLPHISVPSSVVEGSPHTEMNGVFILKKIPVAHFISSEENPITSKSKLTFVTMKNNLLVVPSCKIIPCAQSMDTKNLQQDDLTVFFGAHHLTTNGLILKKCFIDLPNGLFLLEDGTKVLFAMCHIAIKKSNTPPYHEFDPSKLRLVDPKSDNVANNNFRIEIPYVPHANNIRFDLPPLENYVINPESCST